MRDMAAKGRHGCLKITQDQVRMILSDQRKQQDIANEFGITQSMVSMIKSRKVRRHMQFH